jgi:hypothetical protein
MPSKGLQHSRLFDEEKAILILEIPSLGAAIR